MSDYKAVVCKINEIRKHPNADRLQIATVAGGYEVIVDLDTKLEDLGVYFDTDGQLSDEFCKANDLYADCPWFKTRVEGTMGHRWLQAQSIFLLSKNYSKELPWFLITNTIQHKQSATYFTTRSDLASDQKEIGSGKFYPCNVVFY